MKNSVLAVILVCNSLLLSAQSNFVLYKSFGQDKAHKGLPVYCCALINDGKGMITGGGDDRIHVWDVASGNKLKTYATTSHPSKIAINSSNKLFLPISSSKDKNLIVWDSQDYGYKFALTDSKGEATCAAFNPVNDAVVVGYKDGTLHTWNDKGTTMFAPFTAHDKTVLAVTFSADGKYIASSGADNTVTVYDATTGSKIKNFEVNTKSILGLCFTPDGSAVVTGGADGSISAWDFTKGTEITSYPTFDGVITNLIVSGDAQYIIVGGIRGVVSVIKTETKEIVKTMNAHSATVNDMALSSNGAILATVADDGVVNLWDVSSFNIGARKVQSGKPAMLSCTTPVLIENNNNGFIEPNETASIRFMVENKGEGIAYDVKAKIVADIDIEGLDYEKEIKIGTLNAGKSKEIAVAFTTNARLVSGSSNVRILISENGGIKTVNQFVEIHTNNEKGNSVTITNFEFSSETNKADINIPITLQLSIKNTSNNPVKDAVIKYRFPANVKAIDKLQERIAEIPVGETKQVSVQFLITQQCTQTEFTIGDTLEGIMYSNIKEIPLTVFVGKEFKHFIESNTLAIASIESQEIPQMRGNPLAGLNVSTDPGEMKIGKYYALIIGIDKYQGKWPQLKNAVHDAQALEKVLKEKYTFDMFHSLYNETAVRANIIKEFEWLVANVKENDNVFIFYSGHGDFKQELNKGFWVPIDATTMSTAQYVSNSDIQTFLGGIKSKHTLLVSDACFSGDIFRGVTATIPFENTDKYYKKIYSLPSRQAISSGGIEPVMDGGKDGHSVFAYYFLKALTTNTGRFLDAENLFTQIKTPVINNSEQAPKISPIKNTGDEGGQFLFFKKR